MRKFTICFLTVIALAPGFCACTAAVPKSPVHYTYRVVQSYPHDRDAFTQGLVFENGVLYESTGRYGKSSLRKVDLTTGKVLQMVNLPEQYFGEGITVYRNTTINLTWQSRKGFIYDKGNFNFIREFPYETEGWGITFDGNRLIMSDGTATLYFWDPETLQAVGRIEVTDNGAPVDRLNELEYINGRIYANVWQTDRIAVINPEDGRVMGWIDLTGLLRTGGGVVTADVLNGIAYDDGTKRIFVTGKLWPWLFQIDLIAE
ncbi:MAG: glutaminyl-peptide cyclotransferase [Dehalococcoidales bacterium]|nr:glutaminyl-peptide cyclotransferase [Dehalococcoidales bacterium]